MCTISNGITVLTVTQKLDQLKKTKRYSFVIHQGMKILTARFTWPVLLFAAAVFVELVSDFLLLLFFYFFQQIVGLNTNITFLSSLCEHGHFKAGDVHTDFIKVS